MKSGLLDCLNYPNRRRVGNERRMRLLIVKMRMIQKENSPGRTRLLTRLMTSDSMHEYMDSMRYILTYNSIINKSRTLHLYSV